MARGIFFSVREMALGLLGWLGFRLGRCLRFGFRLLLCRRLRAAEFQGIGIEKFLGRFFCLDSAFRNFQLSSPGSTVKDSFPEVVVHPVVVVVQSSESKTAPVVVVLATLIGPGDVLRLSGGDRFSDVRVT